MFTQNDLYFKLEFWLTESVIGPARWQVIQNIMEQQQQQKEIDSFICDCVRLGIWLKFEITKRIKIWNLNVTKMKNVFQVTHLEFPSFELTYCWRKSWKWIEKNNNNNNFFRKVKWKLKRFFFNIYLWIVDNIFLFDLPLIQCMHRKIEIRDSCGVSRITHRHKMSLK